jgi:hypothetical protein
MGTIMNHPTRELLINCGMAPVSAISIEGTVTRGYWNSISCDEGECYVANHSGEYELKSFPIILKDGGAEYLKSHNLRKVGVIL